VLDDVYAAFVINFANIQEDDDLIDEEPEFAPEVGEVYRIALPTCTPEEDPSWRALSLCLMFPSVDFFDGSRPNKRRAKAICFECQVREECLQFALENKEEFGVWGGLDDVERKALAGQPPRKRYR
jgi:Transcription factor WhiB